jgi:hypothetical protein
VYNFKNLPVRKTNINIYKAHDEMKSRKSPEKSEITSFFSEK